VRKIYERFTDRIEPFGIDEAWLDVTDSVKMFGSGEQIANLIRKTVREELGLTCSVGVSFNKVFAKLGSDLKKPDATTVIDANNYKRLIWRLPVGDLLYVGKSTLAKLHRYNVYTIGDLANTEPSFLTAKLGKWGEVLWSYAKGLDETPVRRSDEEEEVKSVGNSVTTHRDLENINDVKTVLSYLSESVSERVMRYGVGKARTLTLSVRDERLTWITRQTKLPYPSVLSQDYFDAAVKLFEKNYDWHTFVRSIGIAVSDFCDGGEQLCIGQDVEKYERKVELERRVNQLKKKYGDKSVRKAVTLNDKGFGSVDHFHDGGITAGVDVDGEKKG